MIELNPFQCRLGVLGGGQLGRMLVQSVTSWGVKVSVLDPDAEAPCHRVAAEFIQGSFNDFQTVYDFGKNLDLVTIEIENVNVDALKKLACDGVKIFPQPEVIELIQDKGLQKEFFKKHGFPTADYILVSHKNALNQHADFLPAVQKLRKSGYDGRGVEVIKSAEELSRGFDAPSLLEKLVPIQKEISVIVARDLMGATKTFPAVEMVFNPDAHLVELLVCPADLDENTVRIAENLAVEVADKLNIVGVLAVEMFLTPEGKILLNELAPRPHNSGHHTIEACVTSQYEQHARAILGLPLGETSMTSPHAVMINLLGAEGFNGDAVYEGIEELFRVSGAHLHLYGKRKTKPFRKMGHVTFNGSNKNQIVATAKSFLKRIKVKS